jgi:hypothetical protein
MFEVMMEQERKVESEISMLARTREIAPPCGEVARVV